EYFDEEGRAIVGDLGDAPVPVLGRTSALPLELPDAAAPAARGVEPPAAAGTLGATDEARSRRLRASRLRISGCASYDDSSAVASSVCAWRSSSASASFRTPFDLLVDWKQLAA